MQYTCGPALLGRADSMKQRCSMADIVTRLLQLGCMIMFLTCCSKRWTTMLHGLTLDGPRHRSSDHLRWVLSDGPSSASLQLRRPLSSIGQP